MESTLLCIQTVLLHLSKHFNSSRATTQLRSWSRLNLFCLPSKPEHIRPEYEANLVHNRIMFNFYSRLPPMGVDIWCLDHMSSLICLCVPKYAVTSRDAIFQAFPVHFCILQAIKTGQCEGLGAGLRYFLFFFFKIKCMIQSSPRNSILGIYWWI